MSCVSHKPQPVCIQAGLSLLVSVCTLGLKAPQPGVEQGKELSLSVKEQSSPKSHSTWADTDGLQPVTFWHPWVGLEFGSCR